MRTPSIIGMKRVKSFPLISSPVIVTLMRRLADGHVQELFHYLEIEMPKLAKEFAAFKEHGELTS